MVGTVAAALVMAAIVAGSVVGTRWVGRDGSRARAADPYVGTAVLQSFDWRGDEARLELLVTSGRRRPYPVQVTQRLDHAQASRLHLGASVPVLVDPKDRQQVRLDLG